MDFEEMLFYNNLTIKKYDEYRQDDDFTQDKIPIINIELAFYNFIKVYSVFFV